MRIGLHDAEMDHFNGKKQFPNYALMKISAWHKAQGDTVEQFQDYLARLFPPQEAKAGERQLARTITFAVTDACSLRCTTAIRASKPTMG